MVSYVNIGAFGVILDQDLIAIIAFFCLLNRLEVIFFVESVLTYAMTGFPMPAIARFNSKLPYVYSMRIMRFSHNTHRIRTGISLAARAKEVERPAAPGMA